MTGLVSPLPVISPVLPAADPPLVTQADPVNSGTPPLAPAEGQGGAP